MQSSSHSSRKTLMINCTRVRKVTRWICLSWFLGTVLLCPDRPQALADGDEICVVELISEIGGISTYRAKCCPDGDDLIFEDLPGAHIGVGCGPGLHCRTEPKFDITVEGIESLIRLLSNDEAIHKLAKLAMVLNVDAWLGDLQATLQKQLSAGGAVWAVDEQQRESAVEFLEALKDMLEEDEQARRLFADVVGRYLIEVQQRASRPQAILVKKEESRDETRELPLFAFGSELETFGYDDEPMPYQRKRKIKKSLKNGATFVDQMVVSFTHPKSGRPVLAQLVVIRLQHKEVPHGSVVMRMPQMTCGFGYEIASAPQGVKVKVVPQKSVVSEGRRHCIVLQSGNILFGVGLAEHQMRATSSCN